MNQKKAKQIRRLLAKAVAAREGETQQVGYVETIKNRKMSLVGEGTEKKAVQVAPGTMVVSTGTIRGTYLALKKSMKAHS